MPRVRLRREPCDCLDCLEPRGAGSTPAATAATAAASAAARQEPPPKGLVLCLTGAQLSAACLTEADVPHLDAVVAAGWAGLLACRADGPPLPMQLLGLGASVGESGSDKPVEVSLPHR